MTEVVIVYLIAILIHIIVVILIVSSLYGMRVHLKSIAEDLRRIAQNLDKSQRQSTSPKAEEESDAPNIPRGEHGILLKSFKGSHLQKLDFIAEIRVITGLGFRDAENIINSAPTLIKEGISREAAQEIKERLEALGAVVEIL